MGKNHKHKKKIKLERSKTQLKNAARELLKRQNITQTEFKIKPIVIAPQFAKATEDGRRDLDEDDVIKRLRHQNEKMKIQACEDMELLIKNNKIHSAEIPLYFKNVCLFIQEDMPNARRAGLKLLKLMLGTISENQCCDFSFKFLMNHLRCAMTHINIKIREDSVLFFDILLEYLPKHMARNFHDYIKDYLMLISALKSNKDMRRTVTLNLESKVTTAQWRIAVLSRLHQLLDVILKRKVEKNERMKKLDELHGDKPFWEWKQYREEMVISDDEYIEDKEVEDLDLQFQTFFSVLYDTWLEGRPVDSSTGEVTLLSEEIAMLFNCVVQTYHIISTYLRITQRMNKIKNFEHEKLLRHLVQHLPYGLIKKPKKGVKMSNLLSKFVITDMKCSNDNILICYNYLMLFSGNPSKAKIEDIDNVASTITDYLTRDYTNNKKMDFTYLFLILKHLFYEKARLWCRNRFPVGDILDNALRMYHDGNLEDNVKLELTRILILINYPDLLQNENFALWLENLPKFFLEDNISADLLVLIINRARHINQENNVSFYKGILDNYVKIYDNLPNLKIHGMTELDEKMRKIQVARLISYFPEPSPKLKKLFYKLDTKSPYWKEIEHLRTERNDN